MSQANDSNDYETQGSSALKKTADAVGKVAAKKSAQKAGTAVGVKLLPIILVVAGVIAVFAMIGFVAFVLLASSGVSTIYYQKSIELKFVCD